ncbi:hypothetical protein [Levilactobacillus cerevisiae]|uniref:hypothetical protein n=1 Tax=Levilactobacillus cerevisiae TaxID=1704076 RepID=UPI000F7AC03E|nr:hypothetical protein [Levilactobacillus cerevisiae]
MYTHLVVYTRIKGVALAYHLATSNEDAQKFDRAVERLNQNTEVTGSDHAIHILGTDSPSFTSIQNMDPYFADVKEVTDLAEFFSYFDELVAARSQLSDSTRKS